MKDLYEVFFTETKQYSMLVLANSEGNADEIAANTDFSLATKIEGSESIYNSNETVPVVLTEELLAKRDISNQESIVRLSHSSIKDKYPDLSKMYDPTDPMHTSGSSDIFIDFLFEILEDEPERKEEILNQVKFVIQFEEIEIY